MTVSVAEKQDLYAQEFARLEETLPGRNLSGLAAGTYDVRVTDAQGCTNTLSATIVNLGPAELTLSPAAPNPTSGPLTLRYGIPAEAAVRLSVLDLQGREIAVLSDRVCGPGRYSARWSGTENGHRVPPGLYIVCCRAAGTGLMERFVITR